MVSSSATLALSVILLLAGKAAALPAKYDQRQEGDLNVRTDVEDVVFVVVPPQDLVAAGMGLVAATAADLLRKNYGSMGPERWPLRTSSKLGFVPMEKSPYKIDLEKAGVHVKKINQGGDPNRYNFHENKNPSKAAPEIKSPTTIRVTESATSMKPTEVAQQMESTTENKTVKKDLKPEETKEVMKEQKVKEVMKEQKTKEVAKNQTKKEVTKEQKEEKAKIAEPEKEVATMKDESKLGSDWIVIGEGSENMDPTSNFFREGCGPGAYRDDEGKCVYL